MTLHSLRRSPVPEGPWPQGSQPIHHTQEITAQRAKDGRRGSGSWFAVQPRAAPRRHAVVTPTPGGHPTQFGQKHGDPHQTPRPSETFLASNVLRDAGARCGPSRQTQPPSLLPVPLSTIFFTPSEENLVSPSWRRGDAPARGVFGPRTASETHAAFSPHASGSGAARARGVHEQRPTGVKALKSEGWVPVGGSAAGQGR